MKPASFFEMMFLQVFEADQQHQFVTAAIRGSSRHQTTTMAPHHPLLASLDHAADYQSAAAPPRIHRHPHHGSHGHFSGQHSTSASYHGVHGSGRPSTLAPSIPIHSFSGSESDMAIGPSAVENESDSWTKINNSASLKRDS